MKTSFFRQLSPGLQILLLMILALISLLVFAFISYAICKGIYGINVLDPSFNQQPEMPGFKESQRILMLANQLGFFLVPAILLHFLTSGDGNPLLRIQPFPNRKVIFHAVVLILSSQLPINQLLIWNQEIVNSGVFGNSGSAMIEMENQANELTAVLIGNGGLMDTFIALFIFAFIPAIAEEFFFRGAIQTKFIASFRNAHLGIWITAFVFSFIHMQFLGFIPRFILGAMLGYAYFWSGSLSLSILLHFLNNALGVILMSQLNSAESASQVPASGGISAVLWLIFSTMISIGALYFIRKELKGESISTPQY